MCLYSLKHNRAQILIGVSVCYSNKNNTFPWAFAYFSGLSVISTPSLLCQWIWSMYYSFLLPYHLKILNNTVLNIDPFGTLPNSTSWFYVVPFNCSLLTIYISQLCIYSAVSFSKLHRSDVSMRPSNGTALKAFPRSTYILSSAFLLLTWHVSVLKNAFEYLRQRIIFMQP